MNANNEERNTYVRKQITNALLNLLREKELEKITVSELTDRACVGRVSFYRNYKSLPDILEQESERLIKESDKLKNEGTDSSYFAFFDFLKSNQEFYTTVFNAGLADVIKDSIVRVAHIRDDTPNLEAYLKSFWAYGLYGWICEWIKRGMMESSEEIYSLFQMTQPNQ